MEALLSLNVFYCVLNITTDPIRTVECFKIKVVLSVHVGLMVGHFTLLFFGLILLCYLFTTVFLKNDQTFSSLLL